MKPPIFLRVANPYPNLLAGTFLQLTVLALAPPPLLQQSLNLVFGLWMGSAAATVTGRARDFWIVVGVGWAPALIEFTIPTSLTPLPLQLFKEVLWTIFPLYLATVLVGPLLSTDEVGLHELSGAVSIYMMIGLGFADIFEILHQISPGSIHFGHTAFGGSAIFTDFIYFSFVTLATLGYGDIAPVHPGARLLAVLEALLGLLFVSILVARMVGLHIAARIARIQSPPSREAGS